MPLLGSLGLPFDFWLHGFFWMYSVLRFIPETSQELILAFYFLFFSREREEREVDFCGLDIGEVAFAVWKAHVWLAVSVCHQFLPVAIILELSDSLCCPHISSSGAAEPKQCYLLLSLLEKAMSQLDVFSSSVSNTPALL